MIACVLYQATPLQRRRLAALHKRMPVTVVEVVQKSQHYDWGAGLEAPDYPVRTLFDSQQSEAAEEAAVAKTLEAIRPSTVFVMGYARRFSRAATAYALQARVPAVLMSDSTALQAQGGRAATQIKRWLVSAHNAAFVAGAPQRRLIESLGIPPARIFQGYDVVDNDWIAGQAAQVSRAPDAPFLCISRLVWPKNFDTLIDAFAAFAKRVPESRRELHILGYGPMQEELEARIADAGLTDRIRLLGGASYQDIPQHYGRAAALFLPSRSETWGLVVNEAMAAGLPVVVSSAVGSAEDLVQEGGNGFVVPPEDGAMLAERMVTLDADADLRARMGKKSREIISNWTLETYAKGAEAAARAAQAAPISALARMKGQIAIRLLQNRPDQVRGFEKNKQKQEH